MSGLLGTLEKTAITDTTASGGVKGVWMMTEGALVADERGLSRQIDRQAQGLPRFQFARELYQNAVEAKASTIWVEPFTDPESQRVLVRFTDNGLGMREEELRLRPRTVYSSGTGKTLEGVGENYGIGARLATLPGNPAGVCWASRDQGGGEAMVRMERVRGIYRLRVWDVQDSTGELTRDVIAAPDEGMLSRLREGSGTAVLLYGDGLGAGPWDDETMRELGRYLSLRYWRFPSRVMVSAYGGSAEKRRARSLVSFGDKIEKHAVAAGSVAVDNCGSLARWYMLPLNEDSEGRPVTERSTTAIAAQWGDELYDIETADRPFRFRRFGIIGKAARVRVAIVVDPGADMRMQPNTERTQLIVAGGASLPWDEWGEEFERNMPAELLALVEGTIKSAADASFKAKLAAALGHDWWRLVERSVRLVLQPVGEAQVDEAPDPQATSTSDPAEETDSLDQQVTIRPRDPSRRIKLATQSGLSQRAAERKAHELPDALWLPLTQWRERRAEEQPDNEDADGLTSWIVFDGSRLWLSEESAIIQTAIEHFTTRYVAPGALVEQAVRDAYALELTARVVHVRALRKSGWTPERIERSLSPDSLSVSALGILNVEKRIETTLSGLAIRRAEVA